MPESNGAMITVVISLRETERYCREANRLRDVLASLRHQTVSPDQVEIIVSDVDSDDEFREKHARACKKYHARHIYSRTGKAWNISRARNIGIRNASAPYVLTTDVDCIFAPNFIETVFASINDKSIVCCRVWEIAEGYQGKVDDFAAMRQASTLRPAHGYGTCQAFPRAWAEKVGGFDELYVTWGAEDTDFNIRAEQDGLKIVWIEDKTEYFHQWHYQGNRVEDREQLARNRKRCADTLAKALPIVRNPLGWGQEGIGFDNTAIVVTTFLRDADLFRCLQSIRLFYPDILIYVADNGKPTHDKTEFCERVGATIIRCPFDCGVSESRNRAFRKLPLDIKHVAVVEDDCLFAPETNLRVWCEILDAAPEVGIVGGLLKRIDRMQRTTDQHYEAAIAVEGDTYYIRRVDKPEWKKAGAIKYMLADLILNVFMMRREVWDENPFDPQFKTIFEHSDFFMSLKIRTRWKVAYTPDSWMWHFRSDDTGPIYRGYRARTEGRRLFAEKWGVTYSWSSFEGARKKSLLEEPAAQSIEPKSPKNENLALAIDILTQHDCKWWLDAGVCLGAIRGGDFIGHDSDIDIGLPEEHLGLWETFIDDFRQAGFELYKEWAHDGKRIELSFVRNGVKLELFFFYRKDQIVWHGAFGPDAKGRWGTFMEFLPHVFTAALFDNLREIIFRGMKCYVPDPPERYLEERYGPDWRTPNPDYKYWKDCRAVDREFFTRPREAPKKATAAVAPVAAPVIVPAVKAEWPDGRLAIGIKTFMREETLWRTLASVQAFCSFPYRLYIADDGPISDLKKYKYQHLEREGHRIFRLPFNSGISTGRNAIARNVEEDYVLMSDDDIALTDKESLGRMRQVLDYEPDMGVVAAVIRDEADKSFYAAEGYAKGIAFDLRGTLLARVPASHTLYSVNGDKGPKFVRADQVPNFFLAKREVLRDVKWDDRIKVEYEHLDWFLQLKKTHWKAAVCLDAHAAHLRSDPERDYVTYRRTYSPAYFLQKNGLTSFVNQF